MLVSRIMRIVCRPSKLALRIATEGDRQSGDTDCQARHSHAACASASVVAQLQPWRLPDLREGCATAQCGGQ